MHRPRFALWPAGIGFGIVAELVGRPPLPVLDAATGFVLVALGLLAWRARPQYALGPILTGTGLVWFLGTIAGWAVYLHRAPLAQLILTHPAARLWPRARSERLAVAGAYAYALAYPVANNDAATIAFALTLATLAAVRHRRGRGPQRRARAVALGVACTFAIALITGAALRLNGAPTAAAVLATYEVTVLLCAIILSTDLLRGGWVQATMTSVVVDLGEPAVTGTLSDRLARTLADPTIEIGYWIREQGGYVDEAGRALELPVPGTSRTVHLIEESGEPLAALIHDPAALSDPELFAGIASAIRLAVANARLQAEVRARSVEVHESRRRLLDAGDRQRRQLARELRQGAAQRLTQIQAILDEAGPPLDGVASGLDAARAQLGELARGIHPTTLTNSGLAAALQELATRSPIPVELTTAAGRWPAAIEAAAYFICSEALTNVAKYAHPRSVIIQITANEEAVHIMVADDGVGGANPAMGSGLRGLQDRAETLGGRLTITSPRAGGTRITAHLPLRFVS